MNWHPHIALKTWPSGLSFWSVRQDYGTWKNLSKPKKCLLEKAYVAVAHMNTERDHTKRQLTARPVPLQFPQSVDSRDHENHSSSDAEVDAGQARRQ